MLPTLQKACWKFTVLTCLACLLSVWLSLGSVAWTQTDTSTPAIDIPTVTESPSSIPPSTVTLDGEALFTIQDKGGLDSTEERAEMISAQIKAIAQDGSIPIEAISITETEFGTTLYVGNRVIMSVSEADAASVGETPQALAESYKNTLQAQIEIYRQERSARYRYQAALIVLVSTIALGVAMLVLANVVSQLSARLRQQTGRWIPSIRVYSFELLTSQQLTLLARGITKILHFVLGTALILFYLSYVLSLFPQTRTIGRSLFGYFLSSLRIVWSSFIGYLPNLLSILLVILITSSGLRFARWIFISIRRERLSIPGFYPEWATPTFRLVQALAVAFAIAIIFPYLPGSDSPAFQGVSIFFGLLVSLGAGGAIFSIVAGFILVYTRAFADGDRIRFGDTEGFVLEKSLFVTRIRTIENVLVSIPNTSLLNSNIVNYSALIREQQTPIILKTTITLGYDAPWKLVHQTLIAAADATADILKEPRPYVWQKSLDDFYVSYELRAATICPDRLGSIYSELHQNLQDYCNQAGIEILSPHYGAMRDGNQSTIPASYLSPSYQAPVWNLPTRQSPQAASTLEKEQAQEGS